MANAPARSRKKQILTIAVIALILLISWIAYDLYSPRTAHLREFDADEVARLETAMWRSYYEKQRLRLFNQLSELLRTQYNMPLIRSNRVAYYAADAAFVFKRGKQRADYEKALPALIKFYESVRKMSDIPFDVNRAAQLELDDHSPRTSETSTGGLTTRVGRAAGRDISRACRTINGARALARGSNDHS
jgi:hypothetical protein